MSSLMDAVSAIGADDLGRLTGLLKADPTLTTQRLGEEAPGEQRNWQLLHVLVRNPPPGADQLLRSLLEAGADPNAPDTDPDGDLPILISAAHGHTSLVKQLVDAGADLERSPGHGYGMPALATALFCGNVETAELLASSGAELDYPSKAALGRLAALREYDENDGERWSAFLFSCKTGQLDVVRYLVDSGIDVSIYPPGSDWGGIGASGLHWAVAHGHAKLARWLVDAGTPVDIKDDAFDNTPLGWALQDGNSAMVRLMRELGASDTEAIGPD